MMGGLKRKAILSAALAFLITLPDMAWACQCVMPEFNMKWKTADAIFTGKVTAITPLEQFRKSPLDEMPVKVDLAIIQHYKGLPEEKVISLHTSLNDHTCTGYAFKTGESYLIYGYQRKAETYERWSFYNFPSGTWDIGGLCGGTLPLAEAGADIAKLKSRQHKKEKSFFSDFKKEIAPLME